MPHPTTLNDPRPAAAICRDRGWDVGTRLTGDEGFGPTVIEITAIGERSILAKPIARNGVEVENSCEGYWHLSFRDWMVGQPPETQNPPPLSERRLGGV